MFNIGASELIVILLIAFIVVGPKDLPKIARALGKAVRSARAMVEEVKREAGLEELEKDFKSAQKEVDSTLKSADPRQALQKATLEVNKEVHSLEKELSFQDFKKQNGGMKQ